MKWLIGLLALGVAISVFGPRPSVDWTISFDADDIGPDPDAYLRESEAQFDDIRPGAEKEIIWAGEVGAVTPFSVVYVHGFSASKGETRPMPDNVAAALGANLFFTRLTGHGQTGEALGRVTANDWLNDVAEALAIGRRLGERVIVIATSQGGTMTTMAAVDQELMERVAGIAFVSPNFKIKAAASVLLTAPFAESFVPLITGKERGFEPYTEGHARWWTSRYPTKALFPVAASVAAVEGLDLNAALTPALFIYADGDTVVDSKAIKAAAERWGGRAETWKVDVTGSDAPDHHVLAGDALSPGLTAPVTERILAWVKSL